MIGDMTEREKEDLRLGWLTRDIMPRRKLR